MNKKQLILNVVLCAAVATLFVLFFLAKNNSTGNTGTVLESTDTLRRKTVPSHIAYINFDTLTNKYEYYFDLKEDLLHKQDVSQRELQVKSEIYQKKVTDYQNKAQKGLITRAEAQKIEEQLGQEQMNLMNLRDQLTAKLAEEEMVMQNQLVEDINEFMKEYNKDKRYDYILSKSFGSNIVYASEYLDITNDVIAGLNMKYKKKKSSLNK